MRAALAGFVLAALGGCAATPPPTASLPAASVVARGETHPVATVNADAADDPAIWRNAADPAASLIVATDKKAGLYLYDLDGKVRHFDPAGRLNNVDLVELADGTVLIAASDRNDIAAAKLRLYRLDTAATRLVPLGAVPAGAGEAYGVCLWRDGAALYAFSVLKDGAVHQLRLDPAALTASPLRVLKLASQAEGCVVDPRSATLYIGEEKVGIWRFSAKPDGPVAGELVARADGRQLMADVEGLALAPDGEEGGWLVASSQGDNAYALYRLPDMAPAGRFRIAAGQFGATEATDGIDLKLGGFGPDFQTGLFVAQDGVSADGKQNFKLVSWAEIVAAVGPR